MAIEIVDFPIKKCWIFPLLCNSSPKGTAIVAAFVATWKSSTVTTDLKVWVPPRTLPCLHRKVSTSSVREPLRTGCEDLDDPGISQLTVSPDSLFFWWLKSQWKDPPCLMGKSTINDYKWPIFNSFLYVYQRVNHQSDGTSAFEAFRRKNAGRSEQSGRGGTSCNRQSSCRTDLWHRVWSVSALRRKKPSWIVGCQDGD